MSRVKNILHSSFVIRGDATIEEAMGAITDNQRGAVVVVGEGGVFAGIVSDGDIRRGMMRGAIIHAPLLKILNQNALVITETEAKNGKGEDILSDRSDVTVLPVVDSRNVLTDVLIRNPSKRKEL